MKKFFLRLKWKFHTFVWNLQVAYVPEFAIKLSSGILRFDKDLGFGWLKLPDWDKLQGELQRCFDEQAGLVMDTLSTQKKMEDELFRMGHASAWRYSEDNTLPYTPPDVVRVVLANGTVVAQKIEIE